jgi:hypothetical protein
LQNFAYFKCCKIQTQKDSISYICPLILKIQYCRLSLILFRLAKQMNRNRPQSFILTIFFFLTGFSAMAQNEATIYGYVSDKLGLPLSSVHIYISKTKYRTTSDVSGYYELKIPANTANTVIFSFQEKKTEKIVQKLSPGYRYNVNISIDASITMPEIEIRGDDNMDTDPVIRMDKIPTKTLDMWPSVGTEAVIAAVKSQPGVSSNNEFSANYSVRGGNYDENLVYINDIEIYRPFLIRSGQQEGLPIVNSNLVENIFFSAGGFEARYGDRMSSVLDIQYKEPTDFRGSASGSIMGGSMHLEGISKESRNFTYLIGARYRTNNYLLNSLETEGDYAANFSDIQSYFNYDLTPQSSIGFFSYFGINSYNLIPQTRETTYGTSDLVLRLKVYFEGQEITSYRSFLNAFDYKYNSLNDSFRTKFIASAYNTRETEFFDIMGQYWLDQVDTDPGSETFGESKFNLGIGTFLNHARNTIDANIFNVQMKNHHIFPKSDLKYGFRIQYEDINDKIREWRLIDSADYSIPISDKNLEMAEFVKTTINLSSLRATSYLQNTFLLNDTAQAYLTLGLRANYWSYNEEIGVTPRFQFRYEPNRRKILRKIYEENNDSSYTRRIVIKAAGGMYYQPPFYRELRDRVGVLNPEIRSQKSYQILLGMDYYFKMWDRTFKWKTEAYYKYLTDIIPYDIDDIRIRYFAENSARGYVAGIDMQLYGKFVWDMPSWISVSLMQTQEDLENDDYYKIDSETGEKTLQTIGFIPRPTDQRFRTSIFFQDFFPRDSNHKVHLNFVFGTPLPFGPPEFEYLRNQYRMRAYKRVDVGFSKLLYDAETNPKDKGLLKNTRSIWIRGEIFNMFGFRNVISYFWVKDVNNNYWGVPNYLTMRRFNVSLTVKF